MAQHYEVAEGKTLIIQGPANIIVKTGDVPRVGNVGDNVEPPVLATIEPATAAVTDPEFELIAIGADFADLSIISIDTVDVATTFIDASTLMTVVDPSMFLPGSVDVTVRTGPSVSAASTLTFTESGANDSEEEGKTGKKGKKGKKADAAD